MVNICFMISHEILFHGGKDCARRHVLFMASPHMNLLLWKQDRFDGIVSILAMRGTVSHHAHQGFPLFARQLMVISMVMPSSSIMCKGMTFVFL